MTWTSGRQLCGCMTIRRTAPPIRPIKPPTQIGRRRFKEYGSLMADLQVQGSRQLSPWFLGFLAWSLVLFVLIVVFVWFAAVGPAEQQEEQDASDNQQAA